MKARSDLYRTVIKFSHYLGVTKGLIEVDSNRVNIVGEMFGFVFRRIESSVWRVILKRCGQCLK